MIAHPMGGISQGRVLAPLALIASVIALIVVVNSSGGGGSGSNAAETTTTTTTAKKKAKAKPKPKKSTPKTYTVRPGDTLGTISGKTGVAVAQIEELNPTLDPNALTVGQKVKLAP
jgi:LysM repeat protein